MKSRRTVIIMILTTVAIGILFMVNLLTGSVEIPAAQVISALIGRGCDNEVWYNIIIKSRVPQAMTAIMAGAGLSAAGLMMQTVFRNPLAGPSVLGISAGASLGVAFVVLLSGSVCGISMTRMGVIGEAGLTVSAIAGALVVMSLITFVAQKVNGYVTLLITGVMIGYMANAIIGVLKFFSAEEDIRSYVIWGLGSFARVSGDHTTPFVVLMALLLPATLPLVKTLNLMLLGDSYALNLGLNLKRARIYVIGAAGVLTAVVTAYCGPIAFLGLAVPHLCRGLLRSSDHRLLLPAVMLAGAALALICNLIARLPGFEGALPVNSVTALIGAPVVMWVLFNRRNRRMS